MKILLTTLNAKYIHINLAVRLLYQLNRSYSGLEWKEFTIKEPKDDIADFCKDFEIVAFSCYIWNITQTLETARLIKALNPAVKILLGGPEVSYDWEDVICHDEVDFIISGEGEIPFKEFINSYPEISHIPNLIRKENGEVKCHIVSEIFEVANFKEIYPYQDDAIDELKNKVLYIETSRGCPYKCEFCLASLDNKVRYLPNENIKSNLLYLMQHGKVIKFLDRTFNMKRDFTLDIFQFILDNYRPGNVFQFEITADILHPDIITFINEKVPVGLFRFEIGIQTVNQAANLAVSRKQSFEKTKSIIRQVEDKVELHLDLIVGMALDYWDDIKYSFEEVFKLFAPELQMGFLKFLKGTPVRHKAADHDFVYDPLPPYQIIESKYLTREQLFQLETLENALEIYWNKKRTNFTLQYIAIKYSSFEFLMGLGLHFSTIKPFHDYTLNDVYSSIRDYSKHKYPEDIILQDLIAIDYCLQYKIRPSTAIINELPLKEKNKLIARLGLNHHIYRFIALEINFDWEQFLLNGEIVEGKEYLMIQYNGTSKPHVECVVKSSQIVESLSKIEIE